MNTDLIKVVYRTELVGIRTLRTKHIAEVTHKELKDYKVFSSEDVNILQNKVNTHIDKLELRWNSIVHKNNIVRTKQEIQAEAELRTKEAIENLKSIEGILHHTLDIDDAIDWDKLKNNSPFNTDNPEKSLKKQISSIRKPKEPVLFEFPKEPIQEDYMPKLNFFDNIFVQGKNKKLAEAEERYKAAYSIWKTKCDEINLQNEKLKNDYLEEVRKYDAEVADLNIKIKLAVEEWEVAKQQYYENQFAANTRIEELKEQYLKMDTSAIIEYCDLVLGNSEYPDTFPKSYELDYIPETKILVVEYSLPSLEQFPTLNEVKVIKNELKEYHISDAQLQRMFDTAMYNITLRTLHELFEADIINAIEAISFNGWVESVNKATGNHQNNCILSIQVKKNDFLNINLSLVDPKTCFKNFKGVGSSKLSGLTPIQPILKINKTDKRFTNHYDVADSIDDSTNLASMDWEDFEHLIREIFSKEFSTNGGEVKVTQASRDGGVDAIAFDPDPIRGGKIVIQAKRYTNTVGVSAVRDLYGTVMNEGATKGILVTTADFGSDAYDFIKGKPLTLMNGANLLYLLEKHGHKARIDVREARESMK
ncbi:MAG: restriction endonuclease [Sphingobacteriia bacterium 28-36-52]|nr:MAG: restriction endonuclease [Sphingobacteriia bacterium 28-36-52]